jgi:hypothetical protein
MLFPKQQAADGTLTLAACDRPKPDSLFNFTSSLEDPISTEDLSFEGEIAVRPTARYKGNFSFVYS